MGEGSPRTGYDVEKNLVRQSFQLDGQTGVGVGQHLLLGELRSGHHGRATRVSGQREDGDTNFLIEMRAVYG